MNEKEFESKRQELELTILKKEIEIKEAELKFKEAEGKAKEKQASEKKAISYTNHLNDHRCFTWALRYLSQQLLSA